MTVCVVETREEPHRPLATLTCDAEHEGRHSTDNPQCDWYPQMLLYMGAAIAEGYCPWGHGRLTTEPPMPETPGRMVGGHCTPCLGWWQTSGDEPGGWSWTRSAPIPVDPYVTYY